MIQTKYGQNLHQFYPQGEIVEHICLLDFAPPSHNHKTSTATTTFTSTATFRSNNRMLNGSLLRTLQIHSRLSLVQYPPHEG